MPGLDAGDRIRVGRWRCRHLVASGHPAPERVRDRIDDALRRDLGSVLASHLAREIPLEGDELLFIRRLELDVAVNADWDRDVIAQACARALSRMLARELRIDDPSNVVRFRNRAEYVATYLASRAADQGARAWFLDTFRGWELLPASAAIRSALCEDADVGAAALRALSVRALTAVALSLEPRDSDLIVQAVCADGSAERSTDLLRAILLAYAADPPPTPVQAQPAFLVWLCGSAPRTPAATLLQSAAELIGPVSEAAGRSAISVGECLTKLADDDSLLGACLSDPSAARRATPTIARTLDVTAERPPALSTPFGGLFLLLDDFPRAPLERVTSGWPEIERASAADALSLVVLGHCLGSNRWTAVANDPCWRQLMRIPARTALRMLSGWLEERDPQHAIAIAGAVAGHAGPMPGRGDLTDLLDRSGHLPPAWSTPLAAAAWHTLRRFARRLPGFHESTVLHLWRNFLDVGARVEFEPDRIVVTLSRPSLYVVLNLTGRNKGERRWPWLDARPFVLFTGD